MSIVCSLSELKDNLAEDFSPVTILSPAEISIPDLAGAETSFPFRVTSTLPSYDTTSTLCAITINASIKSIVPAKSVFIVFMIVSGYRPTIWGRRCRNSRLPFFCYHHLCLRAWEQEPSSDFLHRNLCPWS